MAELNSFFKIAIAPHRNAMRARYKDRPENSTNGVGIVTPLQTNLSICTTRSLFNLVTTHLYYLWSLLLTYLPTPL